MLRSGDVGPHVYLRRCFATPTESQVTDITQLHYEADTKTNSRPNCCKGLLLGRMRSLDIKLMSEDQYLGRLRSPRSEKRDPRRPDEFPSFCHGVERMRDSVAVVSRIEFARGHPALSWERPSPAPS